MLQALRRSCTLSPGTCRSGLGGWDAPLGTEDLKSHDSRSQSLKVWGRGLRAWAALRPSLLVDQSSSHSQGARETPVGSPFVYT